MPDESVKVAVRVRPFNQREKDRNAKCIIRMDGPTTVISNPDAPADEEPKQFTFDYSYWSHDGFVLQEDGVLLPAKGNEYASQQAVFEDLGRGVLNNAYEGYNCSLFAYGQTGSGKSYSMVGYGKNKGIVPITCNELFQTMQQHGNTEKRYEVWFSMLEIYNEQVRDLLAKENPKGGLAVRQNPKLGAFYVQGLKKIPVGSYKEIEQRMDQGTASRTVASTAMNATSSRAHTVVTITFDQISKDANGSETKKSSVMNLVDLAGSERADSTGATGDRLKEGANINKSLSALGNVISALADLSMGKKKVLVPYRDSVLTKLLQNALGGNSKTIMIAALSPADINYDETLGTLRYADRAKKIKNKAVINENPMDRMIRELREENERLKKVIESGGLFGQPKEGVTLEGVFNVVTMTTTLNEENEELFMRGRIRDLAGEHQQEQEDVRDQLLANSELLADSAQTFEEKLALARSESIELIDQVALRKLKEPYITNLNEDPMLTGKICYFLRSGDNSIGRKDAESKPTICMSGLSILSQHAVILVGGDEVEIRPAGVQAKTKLNGLSLSGPTALAHKDRILFGSNHLYVFHNPLRPDCSNELPALVDWEFAQKEIAQAKGFATDNRADLTKDQQIAQEQILETLPLVTEVNAISEELNKYRLFEVILVSAAAQEDVYDEIRTTRMMVKMKHLLNGNAWLWEQGKFMNRRFLMQEMYQKYLDGEDMTKIPQEQDPFWEPAEDVLIGTANVFLQSLAYSLDFDDKLVITDYKGEEEGFLYASVSPCTDDGKQLDEEAFVDDPMELLGKPYHFKVTVRSAEICQSRFTNGIQIRFKVHRETDYSETQVVAGSLNPEFQFSKQFNFDPVSEDHLQYFELGSISFLVYGKQVEGKSDPKLVKMSTRDLRKKENSQRPAHLPRRQTSFGLECQADQSHLKAEYLLIQRKYERLEQKEKRLQQLCKDWSLKDLEEQSYEGFYRAVSALAHSTGTRLKTRVQLLNHALKGYNLMKNSGFNRQSVMSLYYFGEEEELYADEAEKNGLVSMDTDSPYYAEKVLRAQKIAAQRQNGDSQSESRKGSILSAKGEEKTGSKACLVM